MTGRLADSGGVAFRAPLLPFATLAGLTAGVARAAWENGGDLHGAVGAERAHLDARLRELLRDETVRAALALASPDLDDAVERWLRTAGAAPPRGLLGYVARMAGRCVPFGLFAGCAGGEVAGEPAYELHDARRTRTRLDLGAADRLVTAQAGDPGIRDALAFVPNSTLHAAGDRLRLVERVADGLGVRYHPLAVEDDEALRAVLDAARDGAPLPALAAALAGEDVPYDEAYEFVTELVAAQLLVPDVPLVTGEPRTPAAGALAAFDEHPTRERLAAARAAVAEVVPGGPADGAVHVDLTRPGRFVLGEGVLAEARRAVEVLHPLFRESPVDADLAEFRAAFAARYGAVEMPLLEVLDPEVGIGFGGAPAVASAGAPLLRGFSPARQPDGPRWTPVDHHLLDLLSRALRDGASEIELGPADLHPLRNQRPRPLPPSLAVVATVAARDAAAVARGEFRLVVHKVAGPNAVALVSRFAPLDGRIDALVRRHVAAEEERRPDATFAEVVHLPERRGGNVAVRPPLRDHEIPVLAASGVAPGRRLRPGDLRVSVDGERVVLRDAAGREVLPRLSAPHDHGTSALPLYRFLAAVAQDGTAGVLRWSWGQVDSAPFLPRVVVGRLVLARAQWRWFRAELAELESAATPAARYAAVQRLRAAWDVPRWATMARGEQEVPVDLDGVAASELLAHEARRAGQLGLRELLPAPDELCLTGAEGAFAHELVLPLLAGAPAPAAPAAARGAAYLPGAEWLGVRVFTGHATADAVLREVVAPLVARTDRWFYERHEEPAPHLRLRLAGGPALGELRDRLAPLVASGRVADVQLDTYRPVAADVVAPGDSVAALRVVARGDDLDARWRAALWGVDRLLADAGLDVEGRAAAARRLRDGAAERLGETGARAIRHAGRVHRARPPGEPDAALAAVLDERSAVTAPLLRDAPADLVGAACAAHVNRLLRAAHDVQQVVVYDLLDRRYRALLARAVTPRRGAGRS